MFMTLTNLENVNLDYMGISRKFSEVQVLKQVVSAQKALVIEGNRIVCTVYIK